MAGVQVSGESAVALSAPTAQRISSSEMLRRCLGAFETEACSRCGGSGWYSHCEEWGETCFQCGYEPKVKGTGFRFTKRGKMARAHFLTLLPTRAASALQSGDKFIKNGSIRTVAEVVSPSTSAAIVDGVRISEGYVDVHTKAMVFALVPEAEAMKLVPTVADSEAAIAEALKFQASLTKAGKPRKSRSAPSTAPADGGKR